MSVWKVGVCWERTQRSLPDSEKENSVGGSWEPESWKVAVCLETGIVYSVSQKKQK